MIQFNCKGKLPITKEGKIDHTSDFFARQTGLTVSGQLSAENYAVSLSDVYTFGPTFRAENSNTNKHLAEFWMIEPEMSFCNLEDDMDCAEGYVKYCAEWVLTHNEADLKWFDNACKFMKDKDGEPVLVSIKK